MIINSWNWNSVIFTLCAVAISVVLLPLFPRDEGAKRKIAAIICQKLKYSCVRVSESFVRTHKIVTQCRSRPAVKKGAEIRIHNRSWHLTESLKPFRARVVHQAHPLFWNFNKAAKGNHGNKKSFPSNFFWCKEKGLASSNNILCFKHNLRWRGNGLPA